LVGLLLNPSGFLSAHSAELQQFALAVANLDSCTSFSDTAPFFPNCERQRMQNEVDSTKSILENVQAEHNQLKSQFNLRAL
jgi:hypothetical protein